MVLIGGYSASEAGWLADGCQSKTKLCCALHRKGAAGHLHKSEVDSFIAAVGNHSKPSDAILVYIQTHPPEDVKKRKYICSHVRLNTGPDEYHSRTVRVTSWCFVDAHRTTYNSHGIM